MFLKAYDEIDRGYWPAHVAAAEYYVSHDDDAKRGEGTEEPPPTPTRTISTPGGHRPDDA